MHSKIDALLIKQLNKHLFILCCVRLIAISRLCLQYHKQHDNYLVDIQINYSFIKSTEKTKKTHKLATTVRICLHESIDLLEANYKLTTIDWDYFSIFLFGMKENVCTILSIIIYLGLCRK